MIIDSTWSGLRLGDRSRFSVGDRRDVIAGESTDGAGGRIGAQTPAVVADPRHVQKSANT